MGGGGGSSESLPSQHNFITSCETREGIVSWLRKAEMGSKNMRETSKQK